jgi:hypothetical protein
LAGLVLIWLADSLFWAVVWGYDEANWPEPLRLLWLAIYQMVLPVVLPALIGLLLARWSKGREMAVTMAVSLVMA